MEDVNSLLLWYDSVQWYSLFKERNRVEKISRGGRGETFYSFILEGGTEIFMIQK